MEHVAGSATGTVVGAGGSAVVSSGGTANALVLEGGSALVMSGGTFSGATISGGTLEVASGAIAMLSSVTFDSGTLVLDDAKFRGKIANFNSVDPDAIDLRTVAYGSSTTSSYVDNGASGTLIVSDGTHTARLAILGSYAAGNFHLATDGQGGTRITDPVVDSGTIASPH